MGLSSYTTSGDWGLSIWRTHAVAWAPVPISDPSDLRQRRLPRVRWWATVGTLVLLAFLAQGVSRWLPLLPASALSFFLIVTARVGDHRTPS
jgi:hypothetical protein